MNASTTGILPGSTNAKLVAGAVFIFVALIVMFAVNTKYNFLPAWLNLFQKLGLVRSEDATFWTDPNSMTALAITQTQLPANFPTRFGYTMMFDTMIFNSRASFTTTSGGTLPYRHLLHRGSDDLGNAGTPAGCGGGGNSTASTDGFPKYMNPGFIGDRSTNDILVFIDTSAGRESARISNLSLVIPYRFGLVVYEGFFEIYQGCKLLLSQVLKGTPIAINPSGIYALAGPFALSAKLQNLRIWSTTLPVQQVVRECSGAIQPFGNAPPCTAISVNPTSLMSTSSTTGTTTDATAAATIASVTATQCPTIS
jgi:hypothetical protein